MKHITTLPFTSKSNFPKSYIIVVLYRSKNIGFKFVGIPPKRSSEVLLESCPNCIQQKCLRLKLKSNSHLEICIQCISSYIRRILWTSVSIEQHCTVLIERSFMPLQCIVRQFYIRCKHREIVDSSRFYVLVKKLKGFKMNFRNSPH